MILTVITFIAVIAILVLIHEYGHFITARKNGIKVKEFGFGFPPKIFGIKHRGTIYSLNLIPLGGFVQLKGEDSLDTSKDSFNTASFSVKTKIILSGIIANFLLAYSIILLLCFIGLPPVITNQFSLGKYTTVQPQQVVVGSIQKNSAAEKAGLSIGSIILQVNNENLAQAQDLFNFTKNNAGKTIELSVKQKGKQRNFIIQLGQDKNNGYLGVIPFNSYKIRYSYSAPIVAFGILLQLISATLGALWAMIIGLFIKGSISGNIAGPIGIAMILSHVISFGISYVLLFIASISISLGVINALPLPALDGGRLALLAIRKYFRGSVSQAQENLIHMIGLIILIVFMLLVTYFDIKKL